MVCTTIINKYLNRNHQEFSMKYLTIIKNNTNKYIRKL